jgi:PAS domain S-box-containing protein
MSRSNTQPPQPVEDDISTPKSIRVIHVDDDETFLKITRTYLKKINDRLELHSFNDPEKVLNELLNDNGTNFSCVVSDFQLGDSSGIDLFLKIRAELEIPFIIFSSSSDSVHIIRALNLGVDRYIKKGKDMTSQFRELNFAIQEVVTRRRMAQQYESLFQETPIGLLTTDTTGKIRSINRTGLQLLGSPNVEATKSINMLTFPPLQHSGISADLERCIETKQNIQTERLYKTKWGKEAIFKIKLVPLLNENKEVYLILVSFDHLIDAANQRIQVQLQESEERLRAFLNSATENFLLFDSDLNIIEANQVQLDYFANIGILPKEVFKMNLRNMIPATQIEKYLNVIRTGVSLNESEVSLHPDVGKQNQYLSIKAFKVGEGLGLITTDITELEAQRKELSDFVHFMAHDVTSSLTVLSGFTQILQDGTSSGSAESYIQKILAQITSIQTLLDESLVLADAGIGIDPDKMQIVDLNALIWEVSGIFVPTTIDFEAVKLPVILSSREKLQQVFKNLLENAVTHGNPQRISVSYQETSEGKKEIIFENDGTMIPPEDIPNIFQRGFSTRKGGTGLGLTIVQKILEALGWSITCYSKPECTQFRIQMD